MAQKNGKIKKVNVSPKIKKNIIYKLNFAKKGTEIRNWKFEKFGVYILRFKNREEMMYKLNL